ncbi:MAG: hypothetical protein U0232_16875 [Thermomicrobiales bacterium]
MAQGDNPVVQQLEEQMARIQERLRRPQRSGGGWLKLLGGLGLGAIVGGALAFYLRSREDEPAYAPPPPPPAPPRRDDAILLRPAPRPARPGRWPTMRRSPSRRRAPRQHRPPRNPLPHQPGKPPQQRRRRFRQRLPAIPRRPPKPWPKKLPPPRRKPPRPRCADRTRRRGRPHRRGSPGSAGGRVLRQRRRANRRPVPGQPPDQGQHQPERPADLLHPDSNNYERTKAEACFASEADAEAAGFRKSRS